MITKLSAAKIVTLNQQADEIRAAYSTLLETNSSNLTDTEKQLRYMQLDNMNSLLYNINLKLAKHCKVSVDSIELGFDVRTGVEFN
jgi:hypothetical protein